MKYQEKVPGIFYKKNKSFLWKHLTGRHENDIIKVQKGGKR